MSSVKKFFILFLSLLFLFIGFETLSHYVLESRLEKDYPYKWDLLGSKINSRVAHVRFIASPYFGYICNPDRKDLPNNQTCNNHGFRDPKDFPYEKKSNKEVVVGLFGSSVAENLSNYIFNNSHLLKNELSQTFGDKTPVFLNFSLGAYRSWQTFNCISYYLNMLDVVVVLDGQNEIDVPISSSRTAFIDFPPFREKFFSASFQKTTFVFVSDSIATILYNLYSKIKNHPALRSSDLYFLLLNSSYEALNTLTNFIVNYDFPLLAPDKKNLDPLLERWQEATSYSRALTLSQGKKYLHFVQPSPYFSDIKPMGEKEKAIVLKGTKDEPSWRRDMIQKRHSYYIRHFSTQIPESQSLETLFDSHPEEIYTDDCCHINDVGNKIVFLKILEELRKVL